MLNMTYEERLANLEQARIKRADTTAFNEANKHLYKTEYLDAPHWRSLGTKHNVRMLSEIEPISAKIVRKAIRKTGITFDLFNDHNTSLNHFVANNPELTAFAVIGLCLELKEMNCL
jgi:hypothetical protein